MYQPKSIRPVKRALFVLEEFADYFIKFAAALVLSGLIYFAGYLSGSGDSFSNAADAVERCGKVSCFSFDLPEQL